MDSNVTGLLTALIMFFIGSGPVRGFAVTTGLGIITSMFTAVYVTRTDRRAVVNWKQPKDDRGLRGSNIMAWRLRLVPEKTNIDFFKLQWLTFGISVLAVIASLLLVATIGLNFGVDFKGGTTIRTESTTPVDVGVYRDALATGWTWAMWRSPRSSTRPSATTSMSRDPHRRARGRRGGHARGDRRGGGRAEGGRSGDHLRRGRIGRPQGVVRADLEGADRGGGRGPGIWSMSGCASNGSSRLAPSRRCSTTWW
jgi:hypothetical protein